MQPLSAAQLVDHLRYNHWATSRVLNAVLPMSDELRGKELPSSFPSINATLDHLYSADQIWFARLEQRQADRSILTPVPPDFAQFAEDWIALLGRMCAWAKSLQEDDWLRI